MEQSKKRQDSPLISVILLGLLLTAIIIFAIVITSRKGSGPSSTKKETVSFPLITQNDDTSYNYFPSFSTASDYDVYEHDGIELIFSSVSYPILDGGCGEHIDAINSDILSTASEHLVISEHQRILAIEKYDRSQNSAEGFIPHEFIFDCKSITAKGRFLSVLFTYTKTVSLSEPSLQNVALLYDLTTGEKVDMSSLLGIDRDSAVAYVKSIISQDIAINPEMYYVNALEQLEYVIDLSDVYLTEEGAVIFFDSEVLTPSVYGIRTFLIPYSKIGY